MPRQFDEPLHRIFAFRPQPDRRDFNSSGTRRTDRNKANPVPGHLPLRRLPDPQLDLNLCGSLWRGRIDCQVSIGTILFELVSVFRLPRTLAILAAPIQPREELRWFMREPLSQVSRLQPVPGA